MPRFQFDCPTRWSDMDSFGHVNNVRYLTYFEEARVAMLFHAAAEAKARAFASGVVVARHEVDYLRPVDYAQAVRIEVWAEEIRNGSFSLAYELFADGELASRARTVMVPYDLAAGRSRRLAEDERAFLERWKG